MNCRPCFLCYSTRDLRPAPQTAVGGHWPQCLIQLLSELVIKTGAMTWLSGLLARDSCCAIFGYCGEPDLRSMSWLSYCSGQHQQRQHLLKSSVGCANGFSLVVSDIRETGGAVLWELSACLGKERSHNSWPRNHHRGDPTPYPSVPSAVDCSQMKSVTGTCASATDASGCCAPPASRMRKYSETREAIESFARATHVSIFSATCGEELLAMRELDTAEVYLLPGRVRPGTVVRSSEGYLLYKSRLSADMPLSASLSR